MKFRNFNCLVSVVIAAKPMIRHSVASPTFSFIIFYSNSSGNISYFESILQTTTRTHILQIPSSHLKNSVLQIDDMIRFTFKVSGNNVANSSLCYSVISDILLFRHTTFRWPRNIRNVISNFVNFCEIVQKIKMGTHTEQDVLISLIIPPETLYPTVLRTFLETL